MSHKENLAMCEEFLMALADGIPEDERLMVGYAAEVNGENSHWWPTPYVEGDEIQANKNCYVCISSFVKTPHPATGKMRYWRTDSGFGHGLALMVDDVGDGIGSKGGWSVEAISLILPPSAVVETSPGNYQCWYFFDKPEPNKVWFKCFLMSFAKYVLMKRGGDITIRDVTRFGRMPIGINNKRVPKTMERKYPAGTRTRLVPELFDPTNRYSIDEICRAFKFQVDPPPPPRELPPGAGFDAIWFDEAVRILNHNKMGERYAELRLNGSGKYRIVCPWGDEHSTGDANGAHFRGPIPGAEHDYVFGCSHDSCQKKGRKWSQFVDAVVIAALATRLDKANNMAPSYDDLQRSWR